MPTKRVDDQSKLLKKQIELCLENDNLKPNGVPVAQWNFDSISTNFDSLITSSPGMNTIDTIKQVPCADNNNACAIDNIKNVPRADNNINNITHHNNGYHVPGMSPIDNINHVPRADNNINNVPRHDNNGYQVPGMSSTDNINHVPCADNKNALAIDNIKNVPCADNNINKNSAINNAIITLNNITHKEHTLQPSPLSNQHVLQSSPLTNQQNMAILSKTTKPLALLTKEVPNMEELMNNVIELDQLLHNASTIDTPMINNKDNETLILVMISSMKQIVDDSRTNDSAYGANNTNNGEFDHNNHKV